MIIFEYFKDFLEFNKKTNKIYFIILIIIFIKNKKKIKNKK